MLWGGREKRAEWLKGVIWVPKQHQAWLPNKQEKERKKRKKKRKEFHKERGF